MISRPRPIDFTEHAIFELKKSFFFLKNKIAPKHDLKWKKHSPHFISHSKTITCERKSNFQVAEQHPSIDKLKFNYVNFNST